jgi:hypothetical protein
MIAAVPATTPALSIVSLLALKRRSAMLFTCAIAISFTVRKP